MCKAILLALLVSAVLLGQSGNTRTRRGSSSKSAETTGPYKIPSPTFKGTLKVLDNQEIVLQMEGDQTVSIRRTRKTKFLRNDKDVKPSDIPIGTSLEVDVTEGPDLKPVALKVIVKSPSTTGV